MAFIELDLRSGYLNSHEEVWMILPDEKPPKDGYQSSGCSTERIRTAPNGSEFIC